MNLTQLKEDLNNKCPHDEWGYFNTTLFKRDSRVYRRRSFDDLFLYYRKFKVTEKMLIKALYEAGFGAKVCANLKKTVFFKGFKKQPNTFWAEGQGLGYASLFGVENSKYTKEYLDKLFISTKL